MYKASQEAGGEQAGPQANANGGGKTDDVTDVDYEEVK